MVRLLVLALCAAEAAAFAAPLAFSPSLQSMRLAVHQGPMPLRRGTTVTMTAAPKGLKSALKKFVASGALSLCLLAGSPVRASESATMTDFDFEEDLADDEMALVEAKEEVEIDYTGLRKLSLGQEVAKYGILAGIFGGGAAWSYWEGKREDRDEEERVKKEVERIEKWKKEFIDMDDVVSDDDMFASLQKRMSGEGKEDVEGLDGTGSVPENYNPDTAVLEAQMKKIEEEAQMKKIEEEAKEEEEEEARFSALQAELSQEESEDKVADVDAEQMERLKRMFGGAGDSPKDGDAKK